MITQAMYLGVFVDDLEAAIRFYHEQLGLRLDGEASIPGQYARFNLSDSIALALFQRDTAIPSGPRYEFGLIIDDADGTHAHWKERGVQLADAPQDMPFGRTFALLTPEGYSLRIIQPS